MSPWGGAGARGQRAGSARGGPVGPASPGRGGGLLTPEPPEPRPAAGMAGSVLGVAWTADDRHVLGCSADRGIRVFESATSREVHALTGHRDKVTHVACVGHDTSRAVSAGADRCLKVWDLGSGYCRQTFLCHSTCLGVAADPSGQVVVSGHFDGALRMWDARSGKQERDLEAVHGAGVPVVAVGAAHVSAAVATAGRDGSVRVVDLRAAGERRALPRSPDMRVAMGGAAVCLSPDDAFVAAASHGGALVVWDALAGGAAVALPGPSPLAGVSWSKLGTVATTDKAGNLALWGS